MSGSCQWLILLAGSLGSRRSFVVLLFFVRSAHGYLLALPPLVVDFSLTLFVPFLDRRRMDT